MEEKRMLDPYGKNRIHIKIKCKICPNEFWRPKKDINKYNNFCSNKCYNVDKSNKDHHYKLYIKRWLAGDETGNTGIKCIAISHYVRKWIFEKNNNSCQECGWNKINQKTGNSPLEIHHIDGNWKNTVSDNLKL